MVGTPQFNAPEPPIVQHAIQRTIAPDVLLSLATIPALLLMLGSRAVFRSIQELGEASEEMFRSDRLPTLHNPVQPPDSYTS